MNSVADYEELVIMNEFMKEQTKAEVKLQGAETIEKVVLNHITFLVKVVKTLRILQHNYHYYYLHYNK